MNATNCPRIWDTWEPRFYGSGTTIVATATTHKPHLYVYADSAINEDRYMRDRYGMCRQLAEFMNGGDRPEWLDDFERTTETHAVSLAGASITAVGPMVDRNPPACDWWTDDSDEAVSDRARLMDSLFAKDDQ